MRETEKLKLAERQTDMNPTEQQIEEGTYRKGNVTLKTFPITIENPAGSIRSGIDEQGAPWETKMTYSYGYFKNTVGADGDEVDIFIGPEIENNFDVYIIDQVEEQSREFDEHKVMFGFASEGEAVKAYLDNYQTEWTGFKNITSFTLESFKEWLSDSDATKIPVKKENVKPMNYLNAAEKSDKINIIQLKGEVIEGETLKNLIKQTGSISQGESLVLEIASPGGSVAEGLEIMIWLENLSKAGVQIITVVTANAYSIASLIMLAADIKLISRHGKVMVHNPMVPELSYVNANELEKHIYSLRELEGYMYQLYQTFTGLDEEGIKLLMDNETYLGPEEAVSKGFADMVVNVKKTPYEMAGKRENTVNMSKTVNMLKHIIAKVNNSDFVNQLYYDNEGGEIEIYQADPAQYQIGDRASVEDGEVQLADGSKLIIEAGVVKDVLKGEVAPQEAPAAEEIEVAPAVAPIEEIVDQDGSTGDLDVPAVVQEEVVAEPIAGEFNEGTAPVAPEVKAADAMPASVTETVESTVSTTETVAQVEEPVAQVEEPVAQVDVPAVVNAVEDEEKVALKNQVEELQARMKAQDDSITEMRAMMKAQAVKGDEFQSVAAEAIDALATSTVSGFKPESRAVNSQLSSIGKKSIFQTLRNKANLAK